MIINVLEYLENSANHNSNKVLFADQNKEITYAQAVSHAKEIGTILANKYKTKNRPIAVLIDRNIESLIMFLGIAYSGNFYVPIDLGLPEERVKSMLETISPVAILGLKDQFEKLPDRSKYSCQAYEDFEGGSVEDSVLEAIRNSMIDTDPLYAIFTSGSTGVPKAVLVSHRSVIDLVEHFGYAFNFTSDEVFGNQAPFDFDVSVKDIYLTLKNGATLHVIPKQLFAFPVKLIEHLNEKKITTVIWATTALCIVANLRAMKKILPQYLKRVMFSGEVMPIKVLNYWCTNLPEVQYVNLYGPTEITCNCTYHIVSKQYEVGEVLPIGRPFKNTDILVLNEDNHLVGAEEIGELCVRGSSLALGYYNNFEKTEQVFCQNPLNPMYPERIYRTGDLVKYNNEGDLVYCARKDFQIKHMGHRIELGEIEVAVDTIEFVDRCCCLYDTQKEVIVLIYQACEDRKDEIIDRLSKVLPKYMIPTKFIWLQEIPLNKNSKIDRVQLKAKYIGS